MLFRSALILIVLGEEILDWHVSSTSSSIHKQRHQRKQSYHPYDAVAIGSSEAEADFFLASNEIAGGGYAYLPHAIDGLPTYTHSLVFNTWVFLLPIIATAQNSSNDEGEPKQNRRRRVIFSTNQLSNKECNDRLVDDDEETAFTTNISNEAAMTLLLVQNQNFNDLSDLQLEYSTSPNQINPFNTCHVICSNTTSPSSSAIHETNAKIPLQTWTNIALTITPVLRPAPSLSKFSQSNKMSHTWEGEMIKLYVNGIVVAEKVEFFRIQRKKNDQGYFKSQESEGNRKRMTFIGRSFDVSDGINEYRDYKGYRYDTPAIDSILPTDNGFGQDGLEGYLGTMSLWSYPVIASDGNDSGADVDESQISSQNYHSGDKECSVKSLKNKVQHVYTAEEEIVKALQDAGLSYNGQNLVIPEAKDDSYENLRNEKTLREIDSDNSRATIQISIPDKPLYFYPLKGENQHHSVRLDSKSKLSDINSGYNGVIHRNVARKQYVHLGGYRYMRYRDGKYTPPPLTSSEKEESDAVACARRIHVRNAMKHAWEGYRTYAWGKDELKPLTKRGHDNWGGMGTTLVDSMSTLWLMGMKDEFWEARDWVRDNLSFDHVGAVSVFETTIRSLGGLLSAYDLSGDQMFLGKAEDLASRLANAFDSKSGIPFGETVLNGNHSFNSAWHAPYAILSEVGTMQVEFIYLAKATGKQEYAALVTRVIDLLEVMQPSSGLYPIYITNNLSKVPKFGNKKISFGAMGDSFYEYLLKVWLQSGKTKTKYRTMYDQAMDGMHKLLVQKSLPGGLTYLAELQDGILLHKMDHLVCFMGGTLALGAYTNPEGLDSHRSQRDLELGKALAYTCYQMYARHKTGIAPEYITFDNIVGDFTKAKNAGFYILRPETVESLFILYRLTGDNTYREWGWEIFQAIDEHCRVDVAYASFNDVNDKDSGISDRMESFFLAETLKYLYLLQDPDADINLNKYVFNTEAHPLKVFQK